ncbi:BTAD domain-containing putative transcriptional regulator [Sphaerisporangium sp. NPDC049003]|uniref:BTAD domain-containing putative transcriptional regulator n=1 Tax=Sphaerisporangium sp. NPDC049003 TaxID=3364517 RepID=UPI0037134662
MKNVLDAFGRAIRMLAVVAVLVLTEFGLPAMLVRFAGWPLPEHVPSWDGIEHMLVNPIPDGALLKILACPLWLLWAAFTVALLVEIVAAVRGVEIHVPMLGPMQAMAAGLIGSLAIAVLPIGGGVLSSQTRPSTAPVALAVEEMAQVFPLREALPEASRQSATTELVHIVQRGDTLSKIAAHKLGSSRRWGRIWRLNAHKVQSDGQVFTDPNRIIPGWRLRLPTTSPRSDEPTTSKRSPGDTPPPQERPSPGPPSTPATPATVSAPTSDTSSNAQTSAPEAASQVVVTVELPSGGLVSMAFAAGISTAYAASRFHRRRRRISPPASAETPVEPEAGLEPAPTVKALRRAHLCTYADKDQEPPTDTDLMRAAFSIDVPDKLVIGHREDRTGVEIRPAGLSMGLTGAGARDAARVIILDVLRQADRFRCEVIVSAHDAQELFAASAAELEAAAKAVPGLTIIETVGMAIDRFTETHFTRSRMLIERGADDIETARQNDPGEVLPAVLLVAEMTDELFDRGVGAILMSADRSGIGALLLGDWPSGTTCEVDEDGTVLRAEGPMASDLIGARFFHLPLADGVDCLRQLADAGVEDSADSQPTTDDSPSDRGPITWDGPTLIRVSVLGRPLIQAKGRRGTVPMSGLQLQLLVFLTLHPEGATRDEICAALWPDKAVDVGVHNPLRHLRDTLRSASGYVDKGRRDAPFVSAHGRTYRIDPAMVSVDLWDFEAAVSEARTAGDLPSRLSGLTRAANLCHGVLAEGLTCEWIDEKRNFQTRTQVDVLSRLAELREEQDPEAALEILERILILDPDPEETWRRIIRLQLRLDRRGQARNTAALLQKRLQEIGVSPTRETERLLSEF